MLILYAAVSALRLRLRVRTAVRLEGNVFQSEFVPSPFILGVIRPRIYLPFGLEPGAQDMVLAHERAHLKRGDPALETAGLPAPDGILVQPRLLAGVCFILPRYRGGLR